MNMDVNIKRESKIKKEKRKIRKRGIGLVIAVLCAVLCCIFYSGTTVQAQDYAVLTINVKDVYNTPIDDARVSVTYLYPRPEDTDISDQFTKKGVVTFTLEPQREYILTVTKAGFLPHTEIVELDGDTIINVVLEYTQEVPIIHMRRYTLTPDEVGPGEHFQVHLVIENEGTGDALNIKVNATPTQFFSPVQPSSSAYFERLDVGELTSVKLTFAVSGEALSGVYDLMFTITYQDAVGLPHTTQETVGVPILRKPLIKLLNVEYPEEVDRNEVFIFSVEIANIGRFIVNGLYLNVESDMDWEYNSYYIGSLEAGDFDTFTSEVVSDAFGVHTFVIMVGYVDDFNREHFYEESFSVVIQETPPETTPAPEEEGFWQRFIEWLKAFLGLG